MGEVSSLSEMHHALALAGVDPVSTGDFLRGVLAGCGDCIKVLDLDGRLQFMSEGGKRVMEVENFESLKGCPWPEFWTGEGNAQAIAAIAAAKEGRTYRFRNAANTAKGTPRQWDVQVSPIHGADGHVSHLLSISRDVTEEWTVTELYRQTADRQKFLTEELTHRVKNTLATVQAIASQTFRGDAHKEPLRIFGGRIQTLSDAYKVLSDSSWSTTSVRSVVEAALAPYRTGQGRITISGPEYELKPNRALTLALALNELATNAMKYGALSSPVGRIAIVWSVGAVFAFEWRESDGPEVSPPTRSGFGSRLIKSLLAHDFGGAVDLRFDPAGLVCKLSAPAR